MTEGLSDGGWRNLIVVLGSDTLKVIRELADRVVGRRATKTVVIR